MNPQGFRCHRVRARGCRETAALFLVRVALDAAREQFDRYALLTDEPAPGTVEAADFVDAAAQTLSPAFFGALKSEGGDA